ncbi:LysR family transcriptional regulator [Streptomyces sp. NBC_00989]|uniref:helix-turn-helix domain-containing protein n=1 Tax=Streptomyces sp. NBC_00989 TaxID=2903705 RepID=UPI003863D230
MHFDRTALLRPVLGNNYQWRRLHTFLQVAGYRSLSEACGGRWLSTHSVTSHLLRLDEEIGGPLLFRTTKNRPLQPTDLGHTTTAQAARSLPCGHILGGGHVHPPLRQQGWFACPLCCGRRQEAKADRAVCAASWKQSAIPR